MPIAFWRTRYAQMFYHQKSSELPISLRHLGLTQHCQGWHFIINYTLFFPPTHQFSSSKKKNILFCKTCPHRPYQSKKEINFSPQASHSPANSPWKEKELLEQVFFHITTVHNLAVCASLGLGSSHKVTH